MTDPRIPLKQAWLAGILAFLMPGAGHLYQGRLFKAAVYFVCILGLFFTGMAMAGWQAVQPPPQGAIRERQGTALLKYAAQAAVGTPALIGLIQRERYFDKSNVKVTELAKAFSAPFEGVVEYRDAAGHHSGAVSGTLFLEPSAQQFGKQAMTGRLEGTMDDRPVTFQLSQYVVMDKPIDARKERTVTAGIVQQREGHEESIGQLTGSIPRSFWNWFEVPMDDRDQQELHRRLGKYHELAMVFTWIAGLLNVLAIWDAVEGPAYGYGDEESRTPTPAAA